MTKQNVNDCMVKQNRLSISKIITFKSRTTINHLNITTDFTFSLRLKHVSSLQVVAAVTSDAPPFVPVVRPDDLLHAVFANSALCWGRQAH